jgi:acyl-ACP thioesterase
MLNLAADLRTVRPGDKLEIPYELTVSESMQDFWQSVRGMNTHTLVACIQQDD